MKQKILSLLAFLIIACHTELSCLPLAGYSITQRWTQGDCELLVLEDGDGAKALLKMICDPDPDEQLLLVVDYLACWIAESCALPINRVRLVSPQDNPYGGLATLHEWASGCSIEDHAPWDDFDLQQRYRHPDSPYYEIYGPLPSERQGLNRAVLGTMTKHPQLAQIAALDTFLGNADRSKANLYYDWENDSFVGIDLAASLRSPLTAAAIRQLNEMKAFGFSDGELRALRIYKSTLENLYASVSVRDFSDWLREFTGVLGLQDSGQVYAKEAQWQHNYVLTPALLHLLEEILAD